MGETSSITESEILADVIAPDQGDLAAEVAQSVLRWKFTDRALARMNDLAGRNNKGTITAQERQDLEKYLRVGNLINILQAKARLSLNSAAQPGS
ncbi:MAG TPA: hypothetical protein PK867_01690 [Pirellulales bacterium]|nr:hypothetical protein [Pirellulales bacterium]